MAYHSNIERNVFLTLTSYGARDSVLSISSWDYSTAQVDVDQIARFKDGRVVLASTALEEPHFSSLVSIAPNLPLIRIQVSIGAELARHQEKVVTLLRQGLGLDILIDRPLTEISLNMIRGLPGPSQIRVCVISNKLFSVEDTWMSLPESLQQSSAVVFLPPADENSIYHSADRVLGILKASGTDWRLLVFENVINELPGTPTRDYFKTFDEKSYITDTSRALPHRQFRKTVLWLSRRKLVFALDMIHVVLLFMKNPSLRPLVDTLTRALQALVSRASFGAVAAKNRAINFIVSTKGRTVALAIEVKNFVLYRATPAILKALRIVFFPAFKVYWFCEYQYNTRIKNLLKKIARED